MVGPVEALDQLEDCFRAPLVQIPRRFIRQKQHGVVHQSPRNRHALLFATRELSRTLPRAIGQPHFRKPILRRVERLTQRLSSNQQGHRHILCSREIRQQVMPLPHKSDGPVAIFCQFTLCKRTERIPGEVYCTARWSVQRGQQV